MAKPMPPRPRPAPAGERAPARPGNTLAPLRVSYYKRMHRQHVYTVTVGWSNKEAVRPPAGAKPVTLRLLMAGAQVVPSEQTLDPNKPDASVNFFVTPLARGHLRGERLEVLVGDRKVQEVPLPAKVVSQRFTLFLLALTFLVPWFLLHYCKYSPLVALSDPDAQKDEKGMLMRMPGELLNHRMEKNVPALPDFITDNLPAVKDGLVTARKSIGDVYAQLCTHSEDKPLAFYSACILLGLTFFSWLLLRAKRKKRLGKPIPILAAEGSTMGGLPAGMAADLDEDD